MEKDSFNKIGIDFEEKAFYDILKFVSNKYECECSGNKMVELSKRIKTIIDDKARYNDWTVKDDIKDAFQLDLAVVLYEYGYPPVTIDDVFKEVFEQEENLKNIQCRDIADSAFDKMFFLPIVQNYIKFLI